MSEKLAINPERLKWCVHEDRVSLEQISKGCHIAMSTLHRAIEGEVALSIKQVESIAKYLYRDFMFFIRDGEFEPETVQLPKLRTAGNRHIDIDIQVRRFIRRVAEHRKIFLDLSESMEIEHYAPPLLKYDNARRHDLKSVATTVRKWLGLAENNDFVSLRKAIENKGIMVVVSNGYAGDWQLPKRHGVVGFVLHYEQLPVIVVKKQTSVHRQAFTLMHELGHLLLHSDNMIDDEESVNEGKDEEKEANDFASFVLAPDDFINTIDIDSVLKVHDPARYRVLLRAYSNRWCMSTEAILLRLVHERKINRSRYIDYRKYINAIEYEKSEAPAIPIPRMYRHREPINILGGTYVSVVLDAMYANEISKHKALKFLGLKLHQLNKLEHGI